MSRRRRDPDDDDGLPPEDAPANHNHGADDEQNDEDADEARRQAELDAAKAELFGPRLSRSSPDDLVDGLDGDGELSLDDLANFDLGDLDLTTAGANSDAPVDFDEVDDDLLQFSTDPLVKEALTKGVDLRVYSHAIDDDLSTNELTLLQAYIERAESLATLHSQLKSCDSLLTTMESLLSNFKSELGETAEQIASMQERSMIMSTKLDNRTVAQKKLTKFISSVYLAPAIQNKLNEEAVDEDYAIAVSTLDQHLTSLQSAQFQSAKALDEVIPNVERTKKISITKIKSFLTARFAEFTDRQANCQHIQRALLPYASLYAFIAHHAGEDKRADATAEEIRVSYTETMSKAYTNKLKRFFGDLRKFTADAPIDRIELIGNTEDRSAQTHKGSGLFAKKQTVVESIKPFALNDRDQSLTSKRVTEDSIEAARTAAINAGNGRVPFEKLWRLGSDLLVETGVHEYDFVVGFFGEKEPDSTSTNSAASITKTDSPSRSGASTLRSRDSLVERGRSGMSSSSRDKLLFINIFTKPSAVIQEALDTFVSQCFDPLTILALIRVCHVQLHYLHGLQIYFMDFLFERFSMTLGIKFKHLIDANIDSIKAIPHIAPESVNSKQSKVNPFQTLQAIPPVVVKFADFTASVLALCQDATEETVNTYLRKLRNEVDKLINRSSIKLTNARHQLVFQSNLYHYIHSVLSVRFQQAAALPDEVQFWRDLFQSQLHLWAEEELNEKFRFVSLFAKQFGGLLEDGLTQQMAGYEQNIQWESVEQNIKQFNRTWRENVEHLATTASREFGSLNAPDSAASIQLAKYVLMSLMQSYSKFFELMKRYGRNRPTIAREIVPVNVVLAEVRKYARIQ